MNGESTMSHTQLQPPELVQLILADLSRAIRLLLSRRDPAQARSSALTVARAASALNTAADPVQNWPQPLQLDPGLGRARCLQRLMALDAWRTGATDAGTEVSQSALDNTAGYLFVAIMNLEPHVKLSSEAQVFGLWYLGTRSARPPLRARDVFGDLRHLPPHQQLAVGAYTLDKMDGRADVTPMQASRLPGVVSRPPPRVQGSAVH
ncbi:MAG: hypothetical protein EOP93_16340 [Lysobacteraceae bacterium]|nr:MAG: hypothetical protein EOP93_16340 [Xanthomonadaceae bacterium]